MNRTVIYSFANGAALVFTEVCCTVIPDVCHMDPPEGCVFWFRFAGQIPSGALLFVEISREQARLLCEET